VLAFVKSEALHPSDFTIREDGVVRLNPELARTVSVRFVLPIADIEVHSYHHLSHRVAQLMRAAICKLPSWWLHWSHAFLTLPRDVTEPFCKSGVFCLAFRLERLAPAYCYHSRMRVNQSLN
jgi:hypothetical protein